jgi:hypothetical protein
MRPYNPPFRLETFAHIMAEYVLRHDPADDSRPINYGRLLAEHQLTIQQWAEGSAFWTPRINNPHHPAAFRYKTLLDEALRRFGSK